MSSETIKEVEAEAVVKTVEAPPKKAPKTRLTKAQKVAAAKKSDEQIISMAKDNGVTSKEVAATRGTLRHGPYVRQLRRLQKECKIEATDTEREGVPVYQLWTGAFDVPVIVVSEEAKKSVKDFLKPVEAKETTIDSTASEIEVEIVVPVVTPEEATQAGEDLGRSLRNAIRVLQCFADSLHRSLD